MSSKKRNLLFQTFILACSLLGIISQVFELTEVSFDLYTRDKDVMLVEFIMPWCRHCQALQPEWEKATRILAENREYVMGKVNCWESGKSLCDKLKIAMYPEIRLYRHGVYTETFEGERTAASILDFIQRAQATAGHVGPPATSSIMPLEAPSATQPVVMPPSILKPTMPPQPYPQYSPTPQPFPPAYPEIPGISYSAEPYQPPAQQPPVYQPPAPQPPVYQPPAQQPPVYQPPAQQQFYSPKVQPPSYFPPPLPPRLPPPMRQVSQPFKPLAPPYLPPTPPKMVVTSDQFYTTPLSGAYQAPPGAINLPMQTISAKPDQELNFYETIVPPPPNSGSNFQVQEMPMANFQPPSIASAAAQRLGQPNFANGQFIPGRETQAFGAALQAPSLPNLESLYGTQRDGQGVPTDVYNQNGNTLWGLNNHLPKLRNNPQYNFPNYNQPTPYENYSPPSPQSPFQPLNQFPPSQPKPYTAKAQNPNNAHSAPSLWNFFQSMAFNQPGLPTNPQQMIRNQPPKNFKPFFDRPQTYPTAFAKNKVQSVENAKDGVQITEEAKQKFENLKHLFSILPMNAKQKFTSDQLHIRQQQQQQQQLRQQQTMQNIRQQDNNRQQQALQNFKNSHRSVKVVDLPPYGNLVGENHNIEAISSNVEPSVLNPLGYFKPRPIFEQPILVSPSSGKFLPGVVRSKNPQEDTEGPGLLVNYPKPSLYGQLHKKKPLERFIKRPLVNGIFTVQNELPAQLDVQHNTWSPSIKNNPSGINQHRHALLHNEKNYIKNIGAQPANNLLSFPNSKVEQQQAHIMNSKFSTNKVPFHLIVEEPRTDQALIRAKVANRYQTTMTKARLPFGKVKGKSVVPMYKNPLNTLQALLVSNPQLYKGFYKLSPRPRIKEQFSSLQGSSVTTNIQPHRTFIEPYKVNAFRPLIKSKLAPQATPSYLLKPISSVKSGDLNFISSRKLPSSILRLNPLLNNALLRDRAMTALRNKVGLPFPKSLNRITKPVVSNKLSSMQNSANNVLSDEHGYETASMLMSNLNSDVLKHSKMSVFFPSKKTLMISNSPGNVLVSNVGSEPYKKSPVKVEKGTTRYIIKSQPSHAIKKQDFEGIWDKLYEFYSKKKSYLKKADDITAQQKANTRSLANNSIKRTEKLQTNVNTISAEQYQTVLKKNAVINQKENRIKLNTVQNQPIDEKETQTYNNNKRTQKSENKNSIDDKDIFLKAITRDPRPWDKRAKVTFQISRKSSIPGKPKVVGVWGSLKKRRKRLTKQKRKKRREIRSVRGGQNKTIIKPKIEYG